MRIHTSAAIEAWAALSTSVHKHSRKETRAHSEGLDLMEVGGDDVGVRERECDGGLRDGALLRTAPRGPLLERHRLHSHLQPPGYVTPRTYLYNQKGRFRG